MDCGKSNQPIKIFIIKEIFVSLQTILVCNMKKFFRGILLIINIVFVVALLLSTMAGRLAPHQFPKISILSYGYFPLLLVNLIFIIIWLCLSRWEFLLSTATIVLRWSFVPLFFQVGGTTDADPTDHTLKVMTFNAHGFEGLDEDTLMTRDSGLVMFYQILRDEDPDVFCLQECFATSSNRLRDSLQQYGYIHQHGMHGSGRVSPVVIFSKYPFDQVFYADKSSKLYADLTKNGHSVRICAVHLDSYQLDVDDLHELEKISHAELDKSSARRILNKFKETTQTHEQEWNDQLKPLIEKTTIPLIIAGDFNDTPASYIYQQITRHLQDPYVEQGRGIGTTYHGPYPAYRIDYIFHSSQLQTMSYKRVKTNISDHYPIVAQFNFAD